MRHWTLSEALAYGHGVERPFLCPVHGDSRPSASVNTVKQVWYCYTCGARGGLTGEWALIEPDYEAMRAWFEQKVEAGRVYPESWLNRWDAGGVHPYWLERCGEAAAKHFRLGSDLERDSVTYPLRDPAGRVLGVVRRSLVGDGPKYLYPTGLDIGQYLFNYSPEHRRAVVLVEGALDAIAFWRVGVPALAIYGSKLSAKQVALIDRIDPERVVTAFDNDKAGWIAHKQTEEAFRHRWVQKMTWPLSWGKDVDEVGPERLTGLARTLDVVEQCSIDSGVCRSESSESISRETQTPRSRPTSTPSRLLIRRSAT